MEVNLADQLSREHNAGAWVGVSSARAETTDEITEVA
jgi:hypothetical protein